MKELIKQFMAQQGQFATKIKTQQAQFAAELKSQQLLTRNLELQQGQIIGAQNTKPQEALPSDTKINPKQVNVVTTRSRLQTKETVQKQVSLPINDEEKKTLPLPFLQRARKHQEEASYKKFLDLLKQVQVNLPLVDILQSVPKYEKYLKDIVASKNQLTEYATTIYARGFCDLGASINLMPTSWYWKVGLGSPKPTTIILQLGDRSLARTDGIIEDVLVQVGSLIFSVNFVILDFEADPVVPFILGQSFLAMGKSLIDVAVGKMKMRALDKVEVFDMYKTLKLPAIYEE
ncbi:uncharacterized protein LOC124896140 [Capsicum annuum]|uniref:uncharacterized protein LOC124896140 n=1 Tax=Capsicum annuum TaxID=4072 RepID=UPI001FB06B42|nr:uncharacterized protein LOC124896140 [Capsicum annuum]